MDDVIIYPSKLKTLLIAAGSLLFIALGFCLTFYLPNESVARLFPVWAFVIICFVCILFFSICFLYALYRLLSPKPSVIVNGEGIFDNASAAGAGMLKWEEIAEIYPYDFMGQRMLGIVPRNAEAVIARQPFLKRILARMNRDLVQAPFNIPQTTLPVSVDELLEKIMERWKIAS